MPKTKLLDIVDVLETYADLYDMFDDNRLVYEALDKVNEELRAIPYVKAIPIDKPFLKMRYGDYVVYNKKWLINHLQTEWNILQGKEYQPSIPIEFLDKWFGNNYNAFTDLMMAWEKENE